MKPWVKNLKVGDTLFFVSRVRRTIEGVTLPVSKVGRKYVYIKQSEYREIQIERENGHLVGVCGEIYESQAEYDEDQRRSRVIDAIEESMRYGGKFRNLPTPAIDAIAEIINGTLDVAALKAEESFKSGMKNLVVQALESSNVPCRFPAELEMNNGSKVSFMIGIHIRSVEAGFTP